MTIIVGPTLDKHIPHFWEILRDQPDYYSEDGVITTLDEFDLWWRSTAIAPLTCFLEDDVLGAGYLDAVYPGYYASVNVFKRPGEGKLIDVVGAFKGALSYWFDIYDLNKIIGVIRTSNRPCRLFAKAMGFSTDGVIRHHKQVNGVWTDYLLTSILRSEL